MRYITVKLTKTGSSRGPFLIKDNEGNIVKDDVSFDSIVTGVNVLTEDDIFALTVISKDDCAFEKTVPILVYDPEKLNEVVLDNTKVSCLWEHYGDPALFNNFYGFIHPYVLEYPFAYEFHDQILQSVKDYTKSYKTIITNNDLQRIETDGYFNKSIIYNGQQSTGLLEIVAKPKNNLKLYMDYPLYKPTSKVITYVKSDNFYQYNTFWSIVKNSEVPLFIKSCKSLSVDKDVNVENMDYSRRSYQKGTIRAKEVKIRSILDNRSDLLLVSQFVVANTQISHK